ncbi:hypothetical protein MAR_032188 [Mya arenaria]|uniref:Uncharacterized protein n=1 Tax=Mya arenaria TaxID=6604 RepID=A0ABY7F895_MYAAR|nr:hypothetical protein MAR_032188 [Mya arenaria]
MHAVELLYGDNCTLFPNDCCRDDLACINGICECVNMDLQNDEDEDKCCGFLLINVEKIEIKLVHNVTIRKCALKMSVLLHIM